MLNTSIAGRQTVVIRKIATVAPRFGMFMLFQRYKLTANVLLRTTCRSGCVYRLEYCTVGILIYRVVCTSGLFESSRIRMTRRTSTPGDVKYPAYRHDSKSDGPIEWGVTKRPP